jgi:molybdopterin-guanine dinucleotide biosynthesis protein A
MQAQYHLPEYPKIKPAILLGGKGKRLGGQQKALLQYPNGDSFLKGLILHLKKLEQHYPKLIDPQYLISIAYQSPIEIKDRLQQELQVCFSQSKHQEASLIPSTTDQYSFQWVEDQQAQPSALDLIIQLLSLLPAQCPWLLVLACDLPFITLEDLMTLVEHSQKSPLQAPILYRDQASLQPLFALWHQSQRLALQQAQAQKKQKSLQSIISSTQACILEISHPTHLLNINTLEDWAQFQALIL